MGVFMHGCQSDYLPPGVKDYGDLRGMTGAVHLLFGASQPPGLTFSSPDSSTGSGGVGGVSGSSGPVGTSAVGGGAPGAGSNGGGKGGGGGLPFTGLEVGIVAAVGSALTAAGATLRRVARRRRA